MTFPDAEAEAAHGRRPCANADNTAHGLDNPSVTWSATMNSVSSATLSCRSEVRELSVSLYRVEPKVGAACLEVYIVELAAGRILVARAGGTVDADGCAAGVHGGDLAAALTAAKRDRV